MEILVLTPAQAVALQALGKWARSPETAADKYDQGYEQARREVAALLNLTQNEPVPNNGLAPLADV